MLWPLSSHHPFQDIKQPTYRGPPTWLPFLPSNVASSSIVFGQPVGVPQQKLSWSPFITREWMMLDSASPASIPCCTLPPFSGQSCFHFSSHQCLSLCGICQKFPLLPLLFTDPSLTTHFLQSRPPFTFFQVPKTLRLDGATREEGKFPLGNQRTGWPGTWGQQLSGSSPSLKTNSCPYPNSPS